MGDVNSIGPTKLSAYEDEEMKLGVGCTRATYNSRASPISRPHDAINSRTAVAASHFRWLLTPRKAYLVVVFLSTNTEGLESG